MFSGGRQPGADMAGTSSDWNDVRSPSILQSCGMAGGVVVHRTHLERLLAADGVSGAWPAEIPAHRWEMLT